MVSLSAELRVTVHRPVFPRDEPSVGVVYVAARTDLHDMVIFLDTRRRTAYSGYGCIQARVYRTHEQGGTADIKARAMSG